MLGRVHGHACIHGAKNATRPFGNTRGHIGAALLALVWLGPAAGAIDIQFDFGFDTNNFFNGHPERQATLNAAAAVFESRLTDTLTAITPGGTNTWTATFDNPSTGLEQAVVNLSIPTNVLKVYAGGRDLSGSTLGQGGPGGFSAGGSAAFLDTVEFRGQTGAASNPPTDFGPWGGSVTFDILTAWYFDPQTNNMENIGTMSDFYSVAVHELAHLLGFGTADSWFTWQVNNTFAGPASISLNGGVPVPLDAGLAHWQEGTTGDVLSPFFINDQEASMDPSLTDGTRKYFTELDFAGLDDVGWQVIPEPAAAVLLAGGAWVMTVRRRRVGGKPRPSDIRQTGQLFRGKRRSHSDRTRALHCYRHPFSHQTRALHCYRHTFSDQTRALRCYRHTFSDQT
jgi:hypothetical protein